MKPDNKERVVKKAYNPPQLTVYGDLRRITNAVLGSGSMDGSGFPANRTS
jgi:hypothetical protein